MCRVPVIVCRWNLELRNFGTPEPGTSEPGTFGTWNFGTRNVGTKPFF